MFHIIWAILFIIKLYKSVANSLKRFSLYFLKNVDKDWLIRSLGILLQIFTPLYLIDLCRQLDLYFGKYSLLLCEEQVFRL